MQYAAILTALGLATAAAGGQPERGFYLHMGADIIAAPWEGQTRLVDDYAQSTYGGVWDFDDGTRERIAEFGPGIVEPRVAGGKLVFATGRDGGWFFWGDADGKFSKHRQEKFRWNHPYWSVGVLRLRIKQSLPESKWSVHWGRWTELKTPKPRRGARRNFTLSGTGWQTVDVAIGRRGEHFASWLSIETETPGNAVEIDEVQVARTSERAYFRTDFDLPSQPVFGGIWYVAQPQYSIHVNGRQVDQWEGNGCGWWPAWIDITEHLRVGRNCLAFDRELLDWMGRMNFLIVGGVARCADGRVVRIRTGPHWRVGQAAAAGWTEPGFDDASWPRAKAYGDASKARFPKGVTGLNDMWRESLQFGYQVIPPKHLGILDLAYPDRPDPLFLAHEPAVVMAHARRRGFDGKRYGLSYRLYDSATRAAMGAGPVSELPGDEQHQRWRFERKGLKQGVYALYLDLTIGGEAVETGFVELALCGPLGGKKIRGDSIEEGLDLTRVDTIRCGDASDPHDRVHAAYRFPRENLPAPRIVEHPRLGPLLELARGWQWAGYRIRFADVTKPYLVRIRYADVHPQAIGLRIDAPFKSKRYQCITSCGAYTCRETPPTNAVQSFSTLTWPRDHDATLCLVNYNGPQPALVKSVEIFRIDNELPQLDLPDEQPGRLFGYATERGTSALATFFQSPVGWRFTHHMHNCSTTATRRHWWIAGANLIRWLKFTGQNAWCFNAHMYHQTYYPTNLSSRFERSAFHNHLPLLAKMFEANRLSLFAGSEFMSARPVSKRDIYTDDEVAEGADTIKAVSFEGRQQLHFAGAGSNYQHPVVEDAVVQMVRDLCAPMAAYPAFRGVHFMCGGYFAPGVFKLHRQMDLLKHSYDDTSIRRFEQFAGVSVPDFGRTRGKFAKRRRWIEAKAKAKWIGWRGSAVTDLVRRCADAAQAARSDLKCHFDWGDWSYGQSRIKQWAEGRPYADVAAELGVDYAALRRIPGTVHGERLEQLGSFVHPRDTMAGAFVAAQGSPEIRSNFDPANYMAYLHHPFSEGGLATSRGKGWPWESVPSCTWSPRPVRADYLANFTRTLSAGIPTVLWHGYCDCQHYSGGEQDLRTVARAMRSIPPGPFRTAPDTVPTRNVLLLMGSGARTFVLINPAWWPVDCSVALAGPRAGVIHLNTDRLHEGEAVSVALDPFAVEAFRLRAGTRLVSVMGEVQDSRAQDAMARILESLRAYRDRAVEQGEALESGGGRDLAQVLERLAAHLRSGDLGRGYRLTHTIQYCRALDWGKKCALSHEFLVIGPFDNPKREFFTKPTPAETNVLAGRDPAGEYQGKGGWVVRWRRARSRVASGSAGFLDFAELCGQVDEAVAYALVYAHADARQSVQLRLGSDDSIRAWVNGRLVVSDFADRSAQPGQVTVPVRLNRGWNTLLYKVDQNVGAWAAYIEMLNRRDGVLRGVRFSTERK